MATNHNRMEKLVSMIARMETAAEMDDRDAEMSGDDACATLSCIIEDARVALAPPQERQDAAPRADFAFLVRDGLDLLDRVENVADDGAEDGRLFVMLTDGRGFRVTVEPWEA